MSLKQLYKQLGGWSTLVSWNEPALARVRLRGDLLARLALAFGIGAVGTAVLLILFALNDRPPNPLHALWAMLLAGGMALLMLVQGKSTAGGRVRVCEEGIIRTSSYVSFLSHWHQESSWPYASIKAAAIVPQAALGQNYSLLMLATDDGLDMIAIRNSVDLQSLASTLNQYGVGVQAANEIPASLRKKMSLPLGLIAAAIGFGLMVIGGGAFAVRAWHVADRARPAPVAERANERPVAPPVDIVAQPKPPVANAPAATRPPDLPDLPPRIGVSPVPSVLGLQPGPPREGVAMGRPTELVGGSGGTPFQLPLAAGQPCVGVTYRLGKWGRQTAIANWEPLGPQKTAPPANSIMGREGYVVGGLQVVAADLVVAARVVFVRANGGVQNKDDFYYSEWIGAPGEMSPRTVGDGVTPVVGICGRRGAVLDALGLLLRSP